MTEEDFDKVPAESSRVINMVQFSDESAIDPMYVDTRLLPRPRRQGRRGGVRGDARRHAGKVGIGKVALYGREYLVAVKAAGPWPRDVHAAPRGRDRGIDQIEELRRVPRRSSRRS